MTAAPSRIDRATLATGAVLTVTTALAWLLMLRGRATMIMPDASATPAQGALFTLQWGVMMTAMMLPSAAPMILL